MQYIKVFNQINKNDAKIAGGKGASLGEMAQAKIPVPEGFVILADAFEEFLKETDLNVEINAALDKVNHNEIHTIENASETIKELTLEQEIPEKIKNEIIKAFRNLNAEFVAVRSSATAEDSETAAWAGQLESYLNTTEENLLKNVKKCWASLFTPRAIFYRFEKNLHKEKVSVAVVVQKMVESEESGIAFSVHPVTQDRNQLIIEAGFGLGEAIVSGQITPDSYVVEKDKLNILDKNVNEQTRALYRKETGGNKWKDIGEKGKEQVLTDKEIIELSKLIIKIENHYGFPVDVEWAREKGKFYIVQSRPITTLTKLEEEKEDLDEYKKYKWQVVGGDFNSPFIRNYIWVKSFFRQAVEFNISRPIFAISSRKDEIEYLGDLDKWTQTHEDLKKHIEKDNYLVEKIIDKTNELGEAFNKWSEKNIFNRNLSKLDNKTLIDLLKRFEEKQGLIYVYGTVLPLIDFQSFSFVEGNLKKFLKEKLNEKDYQNYYDILTQPIENSFAQDQEEDLLMLIKEFYSKKWVENIKTKNLEEIKKIYPKFYNKLKKHTEKHSWVYYVYIGPAFTEENFLEFIKDYLKKGINPGKKLEEIEKKKEEIKKLRKEYIKKLKPDKFNEMILKLVGKLVWAKPRRKDYQSKSYYHLEKLIKEFAKRLSISLKQARSIPFDILEKSFEKGKVDEELLNSIYNFHIIMPKDNGEVIILHNKEAERFYNKYVIKSKEEKEEDVKFIRGSVSMPGIARGIVKIINKPADMEKMKDGDILVSVATTPSIVPAMKKAAAIVTDEGGLTCHAAIVSRELGITSIVGTKIATQVLKDGDLVEVDADNGIVRILKKVTP